MNARSFGFEAARILEPRGVKPVVGIVEGWNLRIAAGMTDPSAASFAGAVLLANGTVEKGSDDDQSRQCLVGRSAITIGDSHGVLIRSWSVAASFSLSKVANLVGDNSMLWTRDEFWLDSNSQNRTVRFVVEKAFQQSLPTCNGANIIQRRRLA